MRELISQGELESRLDDLAGEINADYAGVDLLNLIIVLRGGCFFGIDLAKRLTMPCRLDYIRVTSYSGTESTGAVSLISDIKTDIRNQPVLVIDDIVDTGFTMAWVLRYLELKEPRSVRVATLLDKPSRRIHEVPINYTAFIVPNVFVAGYGLDGLDDTMANIPRIVAVQGDEEGEAEVPARATPLPAGPLASAAATASGHSS
ncbi:MAG TPA: hypoxanthine phosphoribosyltransferase [Chloroflexota bacterium]|nr:hypoxanthine phosphoribosyltransferase [Chloroflexota bacterium]